MARMLDQFQKVINDVTIKIGHSFVDALTEAIQGPCKKNQLDMCDAKILDSSREYISNYGFELENCKHLGFVPPEDDDEEESVLDSLDEFISKIATMLTSLLEGEEDKAMLERMGFCLQITDLKKRLLNVFGCFIKGLGIFPKLPDEQQGLPLSSLSTEENDYNILGPISLSRVTAGLSSGSFDGPVAEAFEIVILIR